MGVGVSGFNFRLEFSKGSGNARTVLGAVDIPQKTAAALNATGGESLQLNWMEHAGDKEELLVSEPMPKISALKGAAG